jgi:peptidoglycan/LPS O-acetylase OafA/YrhL
MILIGFFYKLPYLPENFLVIFFSFMLLKKKFPKKFIFDFFIHNKIIQYIGLISFSLYLWHWPILVFVEYYFVYELEILIKSLALLGAIILSILSYHFVEYNYRYKFKIITCEHNYSADRKKIYNLLINNGYQRKFVELSKWDDWYVLSDS